MKSRIILIISLFCSFAIFANKSLTDCIYEVLAADLKIYFDETEELSEGYSGIEKIAVYFCSENLPLDFKYNDSIRIINRYDTTQFSFAEKEVFKSEWVKCLSVVPALCGDTLSVILWAHFPNWDYTDNGQVSIRRLSGGYDRYTFKLDCKTREWTRVPHKKGIGINMLTDTYLITIIENLNLNLRKLDQLSDISTDDKSCLLIACDCLLNYFDEGEFASKSLISTKIKPWWFGDRALFNAPVARAYLHENFSNIYIFNVSQTLCGDTLVNDITLENVRHSDNSDSDTSKIIWESKYTYQYSCSEKKWQLQSDTCIVKNPLRP